MLYFNFLFFWNLYSFLFTYYDARAATL